MNNNHRLFFLHFQNNLKNITSVKVNDSEVYPCKRAGGFQCLQIPAINRLKADLFSPLSHHTKSTRFPWDPSLVLSRSLLWPFPHSPRVRCLWPPTRAIPSDLPLVLPYQNSHSSRELISASVSTIHKKVGGTVKQQSSQQIKLNSVSRTGEENIWTKITHTKLLITNISFIG